MGSQTASCPVETAVNAIGGKWKIVILHHLSVHGASRFNELRRAFAQVTQRTMTRQLRELEEDGLIVRTVYPVVPFRVEYALSDTGATLIPLLEQLKDLGNVLMVRNDARPNQELSQKSF